MGFHPEDSHDADVRVIVHRSCAVGAKLDHTVDVQAVPRSNDCQTVAAHEASGGKSTDRWQLQLHARVVDENSAALACEGVAQRGSTAPGRHGHQMTPR